MSCRIQCNTISIHAPLAGSDGDVNHVNAPILDISIHAPLAGSDPIGGKPMSTNELFQSTLPLRGATGRFRYRLQLRGNFNPRSPCGERPNRAAPFPVRSVFQSTLPLRGATQPGETLFVGKPDFNPRSPCRERRQPGQRPHKHNVISIHAPLAGSDFDT